MEKYQRTLLAAQGYCELTMYNDALAELATLPADAQDQPPVVEMRLAVLMQARRWKEALAISREMCRLRPDATAGFIHAAFCLHELGKTQEARELLLGGPQSLHKEATYHYNLACYECVLGNVELAQAHLDKSFELDKKFREFAKTDPDLSALQK